MTDLLSDDGHLIKQINEENLLDYKLLISQMDGENRESGQSFEGYHSSSPCSSESADSYPSSNSHSPAEKISWLCLQTSPSQAPEQESNDSNQNKNSDIEQIEIQPTDRILSPLDNLDYPSDCDSSFLFTDYIDQDLFATQASLDLVSNDFNPDRMTDTLKSQIVCAFQDPDCLTIEDPSYESIRKVTASVARPKTLSINDTSRSQGQIAYQGHSEMFCVLTSPSTPNELQQQLASADIAWMDALDVPNLSLEEIERILSTVNSLRSPEEETIATISESLKTEDKCPLSSAICIETTLQKNINDLLVTSSNDESCDAATLPIKNDGIPSNCDLRASPDADELAKQTRSISGFDSDSTLTCSEAEYYNNKIRHRKIKRIKKSCPRTRDESSEFSCGSGSEDDLCWVENNQDLNEREAKYRKVGWHSRVAGSRSMSRYPSHRRVQNAQADVDMEPWWPRGSPKRVAKDIETSNANNRRAVKNLKTVHKPQDDDLFTDSELTSSDEEGISDDETISPDFDIDKISSRIPRAKQLNTHRSKAKYRRQKNQKSSSRTAMRVPWRVQRRQKQMELWQFILWRLETGKQSAFQWVNRSNGVFRIVDTQAGAKEWGSYRNNKRMDYEKMARAMRFYYKDSILRKARQQLHFQFAMSYVEWAAKYYESNP